MGIQHQDQDRKQHRHTCVLLYCCEEKYFFLRFFWYLFSFWSIKISCFSFLMLRKQRFCMKLTELSNMLFHPLEEILTWQFGWKASYFCEKNNIFQIFREINSHKLASQQADDFREIDVWAGNRLQTQLRQNIQLPQASLETDTVCFRYSYFQIN